MDGPRAERHGNLVIPQGRRNRARGLLPARDWREDCPYCKAPYPWASDTVWVNYHQRHLADSAAGVHDPLPYLEQAAIKSQAADDLRSEREKMARAAHRRERFATIGAKLDTWPKRTTAVVAAIVALLALLFGATNLRDLLDVEPAPAPTPTDPASLQL
jgi:hypothetical protein